LESKVRKKVRNRYAPDNNKIGLIFVDDLNMPIRQDSGAQPPIELLRQWLDHQVYFLFLLNQ
jgi:dynein heavy chain